MKQEHRNGQMTNDDSALSLRPFDSLLFEARLNDEIGLSFNPQPAAQADRRSASDLPTFLQYILKLLRVQTPVKQANSNEMTFGM